MPKWSKQRLNEAFFDTLRENFAVEEEFTNAQAYKLYSSHHAKSQPIDGWARMNVRNNLCAAAHRGILERLGPGRYKFPAK